jgi:hypothetical protein
MDGGSVTRPRLGVAVQHQRRCMEAPGKMNESGAHRVAMAMARRFGRRCAMAVAVSSELWWPAAAWGVPTASVHRLGPVFSALRKRGGGSGTPRWSATRHTAQEATGRSGLGEATPIEKKWRGKLDGAIRGERKTGGGRKNQNGSSPRALRGRAAAVE